MYVGAGFTMAMPAVIIPALSGIPNQLNAGEFLTMTAVQASWLASLGGLLKPMGSMTSAYMSGKPTNIATAEVISNQNTFSINR